jgi:hypothetical protein
MSEATDASDGGTVDEPTLSDLARKLSELRAHLAHVTADLRSQREDRRLVHDELGTTAARPGFGSSMGAGRRLSCHECGRVGARDSTGWTLRLCADDELHTFCPDCDERYLNGNDRSASAAEPDPVP